MYRRIDRTELRVGVADRLVLEIREERRTKNRWNPASPALMKWAGEILK